MIAVYNAESAIRKTLVSALSQSYPNVELVVIDGRSTDGTWSVIGEFSSSLHYKISEPDCGIADAYNKGIKACTGDWIYFLNADDVFADANVLTDLFARQEISAETQVLAATVLSDDHRIFNGRFDWRLLLRNNVHHQALFYRSSFLRASPYNASYKSYGHDHEHNLLIWRRGVRVQYIDRIVTIWARGGISDTAKWRQYKEEFRVRRNSVGLIGWPFNLFTVVRFLIKRVRQIAN